MLGGAPDKALAERLFELKRYQLKGVENAIADLSLMRQGVVQGGVTEQK
jgi:hypothetical protein